MKISKDKVQFLFSSDVLIFKKYLIVFKDFYFYIYAIKNMKMKTKSIHWAV